MLAQVGAGEGGPFTLLADRPSSKSQGEGEIMRVTMITTYAGPAGTAAAGEVSPDLPKEEAEALIKAGHALPLREKLGAEATSGDSKKSDDDAKAEAEREAAEKEANAKEPDAVTAALELLDPENDEHWTGDGKPSMDAIKEFTGSMTIRRADVDEIAPDFRRPPEDKTNNSKGGEGDKGVGGGRRSNRP